MKKYLLPITVILMSLFLTACQTTPEVIESEETQVAENMPIVEEDEVSELLLIQDGTPAFPQNQGVYDFSEGSLTIVKQYLPKRMSTDYLTIHPIDLIQRDFKRTFPNLEWQRDPYKVYQDMLSQITLSVSNERIELQGKDFKRTFAFIDDEKTHVIDENSVIYSVQYDK